MVDEGRIYCGLIGDLINLWEDIKSYEREQQMVCDVYCT